MLGCPGDRARHDRPSIHHCPRDRTHIKFCSSDNQVVLPAHQTPVGTGHKPTKSYPPGSDFQETGTRQEGNNHPDPQKMTSLLSWEIDENKCFRSTSNHWVSVDLVFIKFPLSKSVIKLGYFFFFFFGLSAYSDFLTLQVHF